MTFQNLMANQSLRLLFLFAVSIFLSACSSLPDSLKSDNSEVVTDYQEWRATTENDQQLRLGGLIASVQNLESQTRIEIVNLPIGSSGKPDINKEPDGRFVAYVDGFADPVTLSSGRLISVLGDSAGEENGKVGDYLYDFPVMKASGYHLWRIEERIIIHDIDSYVHPCLGLYCRSSRYGSRQGKVIQEVK